MPALQNFKAALRNAVTVETPDIPATEPRDAEFAQARDGLERASVTEQDLRSRFSAKLRELEQDEARLQRVALDAELSGNDTDYQKLAARVAKQQADLIRLQAAVQEAGERRAEAQQALHQLGLAGKLKMVRRQTHVLIDRAKAVTSAYEALAKAITAYGEQTEKVRYSWPLPGPPPGGHYLGASEAERGCADEAFRVLPAHVADPLRKLKIPGASNGLGLGDPAAMPTFAKRVADAVVSLVEIVERGTVGATAHAQAEAPRQPQADTESDTNSQQTRSAVELMAQIPPPRRVLFDNRSRKE